MATRYKYKDLGTCLSKYPLPASGRLGRAEARRFQETELLLRESLNGANFVQGRNNLDVSAGGDPSHLSSKEAPPKEYGLAMANNLAVFCRQTGRSQEAAALYALAVPRAQELLGPNHPGTQALARNLQRLEATTGREG